MTLKDFNEEWERSSLSECFEKKPDRKLWYNCFHEIGMIYGILIVSERGCNSRWYILNPEDLRGRNVQDWMLACVAHRNLLEECLGMHNRIDIEGFPSENGMLEIIARAMKEYRKIEVTYRRYERQPLVYIVEPLLIKTYEHRFYVLCKYESGQRYSLSFDRIMEAKILNEHFSFPDDLFEKDYFENSFGVMMPPAGEEPLDIVIRAKGSAKCYLKDKPLHKSQHTIEEGNGYADFVIHIYATDDFIGAVMQQGDRLEIISPEKVRNRIKEKLGNAYRQYLSA